MQTIDLEKKLIQDIKGGRDASLERALLVISGLRAEGEIEEYARRLDQIQKGFIEKLEANSPLSLPILRQYMSASNAKALFEYLWNAKPKRCDGNFLLTDVIDAQLNSDINQKVGSCVGLTSLYTVLGIREGLDLTILVSDSHIANRLRVDETLYNIDHTDPLGFDFDLSGKSFIEYPSICLLANVMNSRGIEQERLGNLEKAEKDYFAATEVNPRYANAYNNLGNVKLKYRDYSGAISDYSRAILLNSAFVEAYYNRGIAKESTEDYSGAADDYNRAIEINSGYVDAYFRRGALKQILEDFSGAARDFDKVIELNPESREKMLRFKERAVQLKTPG